MRWSAPPPAHWPHSRAHRKVRRPPLPAAVPVGHLGQQDGLLTQQQTSDERHGRGLATTVGAQMTMMPEACRAIRTP